MGPRRRRGRRAAVAAVHIHAVPGKEVLGEEGALLTPKVNPELPANLHLPPGGFIHVQVVSRGKPLKAGAGGMGKGTAAGRFAPGVPARQLQAGHLPQDPRCRIGAGRASTRFKKGTKLILPAAKRNSVERAPAASAPVPLHPGLGTSIQKEQLQKGQRGREQHPGVSLHRPLPGWGREQRFGSTQGCHRAPAVRFWAPTSDTGGAGEVSPMRSPCSSCFWGVWGCFGFFFDAGSCDAPPPAASSQTHRDHAGLLKYHLLQWSRPGSEPKPWGPGVVSGGEFWCVCVVFFFLWYFFALDFL